MSEVDDILDQYIPRESPAPRQPSGQMTQGGRTLSLQDVQGMAGTGWMTGPSNGAMPGCSRAIRQPKRGGSSGVDGGL